MPPSSEAGADVPVLAGSSTTRSQLSGPKASDGQRFRRAVRLRSIAPHQALGPVARYGWSAPFCRNAADEAAQWEERPFRLEVDDVKLPFPL